MSYNNAISSSDPQALEKLTAKLEKLSANQAHMKDVNAYYRKHGTCIGYPNMTEMQAEKLNRQATVRSYEPQPYPSFALTNNNSEIRRTEKRITEITRNQTVGFNGWAFDGGRAEANKDANRLQLIFDERPSSEKHSALRHAGFVYSPTNEAYQRQLNDGAIYAAARLDFIKPLDGRTVREHQPKPPARDSGGAR